MKLSCVFLAKNLLVKILFKSIRVIVHNDQRLAIFRIDGDVRMKIYRP